MFLYDLLSDKEAKAKAQAPPCFGTEEPLKELCLYLIGHAASIVSDFKEGGEFRENRHPLLFWSSP
jgi:hypothetical protein